MSQYFTDHPRIFSRSWCNIMSYTDSLLIGISIKIQPEDNWSCELSPDNWSLNISKAFLYVYSPGALENYYSGTKMVSIETPYNSAHFTQVLKQYHYVRFKHIIPVLRSSQTEFDLVVNCVKVNILYGHHLNKS